VNYFVQSANIPSVNLGSTAIPNPFVKIPVPGDQLQYSDLNISFRVDENLVNYKELYSWMTQLGFPNGFDEYASQTSSAGATGLNQPKMVYSDATLVVLSSSMNPVMEVVYKDLFPVSLSELTFDSKMTQVTYIEARAVFKYRTFILRSI